jgi:OmpA-OmpF porin, OOP family
MKYPVLRFTAVAALLAGALPAYAADPFSYWYLGLGVGYSRVQFYPADFDNGFPSTKKEFDAGFRGFIGWQVNRNWAFEVGYAQLGKFKYNTENPATNVSQEIDYKVTGVEVSILPTIPLTSKFSLFGRLGGYFSQTRTTVYNPGGVLSASVPNVQSSEVSPLTGIGFQYIGNEAGWRVEYENFGQVGTACTPSSTTCTGRANAKMISVNAMLKF